MKHLLFIELVISRTGLSDNLMYFFQAHSSRYMTNIFPNDELRVSALQSCSYFDCHLGDVSSSYLYSDGKSFHRETVKGVTDIYCQLHCY